MKAMRAALILVILVGCSSSRLDRAKAKRPIEAGKEFASSVSQIDCEESGLQQAEKEGILRFKRGQGSLLLFGSSYKPDVWEVTPEGKKHFVEVGQGAMFECYATLATPVKPRVVEVTGIADVAGLGAGQMKEVKFTWTYDLSEPVQRYTGSNGTREGNAVVRFYDDGWRLERLRAR